VSEGYRWAEGRAAGYHGDVAADRLAGPHGSLPIMNTRILHPIRRSPGGRQSDPRGRSDSQEGRQPIAHSSSSAERYVARCRLSFPRIGPFSTTINSTACTAPILPQAGSAGLALRRLAVQIDLQTRGLRKRPAHPSGKFREAMPAERSAGEADAAVLAEIAGPHVSIQERLRPRVRLEVSLE